MTRSKTGNGLQTLRAILKLTALLLLMLAIIPSQWLLLPFGDLACRAARRWHRMLCRVLGIRLECVGTPLTGTQVAYVGNHLSYLDIPVIGSIAPGRFIAKAEMRHWPLFGLLARLQHTLFVSRNPRDARRVAEQMELALNAGHSLILFPEGTSSAGERVLAFKSSAFSALTRHLKKGLSIQPFTIDLQGIDGHPLHTMEDRNRYAYHADMVLALHLWAFMRTRGARVRLVFHPALIIAEASHRKHIAAAARSSVADGLHGMPHAPRRGGSTVRMPVAATDDGE